MLARSKNPIIPIGCSCINQFQIGFRYAAGDCRGSLFSWIIATPQTTVEVLEHARAGRLTALLCDRQALDLCAGRLRNRHFPALFHWHEDGAEILDCRRPAAFAAFCDKMEHLVENTFNIDNDSHGPVSLLWSNVQPNLREETDRAGVRWEAFRLSRARCARLERAARGLYRDARLVYVGRREDIDETLWADPRVSLLELPRSEKFRGKPGLFADAFARIDDTTPHMRDRLSSLRM